MIRMPMDQDLYDAAMAVMDVIESKISSAGRKTDEEVLGRSLAQAYHRWQALNLAKYTGPATCPAPASEETKPAALTDKRRNRPTAPKKNHPWRARAKRSQ